MNTRKVIFKNSSSTNPTFTADALIDGVTYVFIMVVHTELDNSTYKQEISCKLNSVAMGTNGDNAKLCSTFTGLCKKDDKIQITSYKNGGNFSTFNTRIIFIPQN